MTAPKLSPHDLRRVAVVAGCDPRSVLAFLSGAKGRSTTSARIREALKGCGFDAIQPPDQEPAVREEKAK